MTLRPAPRCRFCDAELTFTMLDLGSSPLCQTILTDDDLNRMEPFYPLHVHVCSTCALVQIEQYVTPEDIFSDYAYFSSYSDSWLDHAKRYAAAMIERFGIGAAHRVVELASNDGYLLRWFAEAGVPALGVEPAANVAAVATERGIPTIVDFFDTEVARRIVADHGRADLVCGNNVLAQVPDLNDFVAGIAELLAPGGVMTIEFPSVFQLLDENQFDTIYHEHFSYFSFTSAMRIFAAHGIELWDVEELPTHGGSLRIYGKHAGDPSHPPTPAVASVLADEQRRGVDDPDTYRGFGERVAVVKRNLLRFLIDARDRGERVVGYGAPGKGNTLLNYCGIRTDLLDYTVDRSPAKHGHFLPGSRIPVHRPEVIFETRPDWVLILPWNLQDEIVQQMSGIAEWGGRFVVPIPELTVLDPGTPP